MKNRATFWLYLLAVLCGAFGIILCFTFILIPIGIYLIAGCSFYKSLANVTEADLSLYVKTLSYWSIFVSIVMFPIGLISLIPYFLAKSNNVKITNAKEEFESQPETQSQSGEAEQIVVSEEEMQKFLEIKKYHEQGIISDEEFEKAKSVIFKK